MLDNPVVYSPYDDYAQGANTLFRFMKESHYLKSILMNRVIVPRYCMENIEYIDIHSLLQKKIGREISRNHALSNEERACLPILTGKQALCFMSLVRCSRKNKNILIPPLIFSTKAVGIVMKFFQIVI